MFAQGRHTVTLTAADSSNLIPLGASDLHRRSAGRQPQPVIEQPVNGQAVNINQAVAFQGGATDPTDGTLSGSSLQWYDTFSDATGGCGCSVNLGSGTSLAPSCRSTRCPRR
ncbi:MAG TPA: hypothetical protein VGH93_04005, partial [Solirubrobacteraceae bacterium]